MKALTLTPESGECKGGTRAQQDSTLSPYCIDEWMGDGALPRPSL